MKEQNFKSHAKFVTGFHIVTLGFIVAALFVAIVLCVHRGMSHETGFYLLTACSLGGLFFYARRFAVQNQDRIIRAEENLRCYRLTGKTLDSSLSISQIIALRFAGDSEYADLSAKAISGNLSAKDIKAMVKEWRADHQRV